jgi:c-di-GMP-binding flagellar brake protein YcgR
MEKNILHVGLALDIEEHLKAHHTTYLLGWDVDTFLMTKAIYVQGQPSKLMAGDVCKIRYLKDGVAYGFESEIIAVQFFPFPLMFLKYPPNFEFVKIRISRRFKIDLPASFADAEGNVISSEAVILDISEGGCGVKVPVRKGKELAPDADYLVTFKIMDKELTVGLAVRKMDRKGDYAYFLGMEFTNMPSMEKESLKMFLDFLQKHTPG